MSKRIYGAETERHTYTVTKKDHERLVKLGDGNASAGIRKALEATK